jgi:uncharacterized protein YciI
MWHLALFSWSGDPVEAAPLLPTHLEWIHREQAAGRVLFAGPSDDGDQGIMVLGHMTHAQAEPLCCSEPFVAGGYRTVALTGWDVHQALGVGFQNTPIDQMKQSD